MKTMKTKKLLCVLLSIMMLLSAFPLTVLGADSYTSEDGIYNYNILFTNENTGDTYIEICGYNGDDESVVIPNEIDGYYVKGLIDTFSDNAIVKNVELSEGIEYIEQSAFSECEISVSLPSSLKYIGQYAFVESEITSISFSEGLVGVAAEAFYGCIFDCDVIFPESLKYLSHMAFEECSVNNVYFGKNVIPAYEIEYDYSGNVRNIDDYIYEEMCWNPFYNNQCEVNLTISKSNPNIKLDGRAIYTTDNRNLLLYLPKDGKKNVDIVINEGVKVINAGVFPAGMSIGTLALSNTVEVINERAFFEVYVNRILFAKRGSLKTIGDYAFMDSYFSGDLVIPKTVEHIGAYAFCDNSMVSLSFEEPSSCKVIDSYAFFCCTKLKEIVIPNSVEELGLAVFRNCNHLESVVFEDNSKIKQWRGGLFYETPIKYFDTGINNGVEFIATNCFDKKVQLDTLDLSNCFNLSVLYLDQFKYLPFREINLENTAISVIPQDCFMYCNNLEKVTLPYTVSSVSSYAFSYCPKLRSVNVDEVVSIHSTAFQGSPLMPEGIGERTTKENDDYKYVELADGIAITDYIGSEKNVVIPDTIDGKPVIKINNNAFSNVFGNKKIDTVEFPDTLKYIGANAFKQNSLKQIPAFPDSLGFIGDRAFSGTGLSGSLIIPDSVNTISSGAFQYCKFDNITIGKNVKIIGEYAFNGCLCESITIPDSVISLDPFFTDGECLKSIDFGNSGVDVEEVFKSDAIIRFYYYSTLESITVSSDNERYSTVDGILYSKDMTKLIYYPLAKQNESFTIPKTVKTITGYSFLNSYLKNVTVGDSVECIEDFGFYCSPSIERVYISGNVSEIGAFAFSNMANLKYAEFGEGLNVYMLGATFAECDNLETVVFSPKSSVDLMISTFASSGIKNVTMPENVKTINSAFYGTKNLEQIELPDSLEYMIEAFSYSGIRSIEIPSKVTAISGENFYCCRELADIKLGNVTAILSEAFASCDSLESIDLTGVVYVADDAFENCKNLKKLYFTRDEQGNVITENEFQGNETVETIVVGNSITEIQDYAFADCINLENALIADSVTEIADTAFDNCDNLNIVCRPNSYAMSYAQRNSIPYTTFVVAPIEDQKYTGSEITPELDVKAQNKELTVNNDYTAVYTDNINIGTAKVNVIGLDDYSIFASLVKFNIVGDKTSDETDNNQGNVKPNPPAVDDKKPDTSKPDVTNPVVSSNNSNNSNNHTNQSNQGNNNDSNKNNESNKNNQSDNKNQSSQSKPTVNSNSKTNSNYNSTTNKSAVSQGSISNKPADSAEKISDSKTADKADNDALTADNSAENNDAEQASDTEKKENIFKRIFNAIRNLFVSIIDFFKSLFK